MASEKWLSTCMVTCIIKPENKGDIRVRTGWWKLGEKEDQSLLWVIVIDRTQEFC